jgi:hypothetical protein
VQLLAELLRAARRALRPCLPVLLDTLCGAMRDPQPAVAAAARAALLGAARRRQHARGGDGGRADGADAAQEEEAPLAALLLEGFERRLGSLAAATRAASSAPLTRALQVLSAQLELLVLHGALASLLATQLGALVSALLATCRLEVPPAAVEQRLPYRLRRASSGGGGGSSRGGAAERLRHLRYSAKPFAFLRDAAAVAAMQHLCRQLGRLAPLPSLVHQLCHIVLTATREDDGDTAPAAPPSPMPPPSAAAGAAVPLGGAVRVVEAVSGAALPRAEALWVLDQVLLGAGEEEGEAAGEEAEARATEEAAEAIEAMEEAAAAAAAVAAAEEEVEAEAEAAAMGEAGEEDGAEVGERRCEAAAARAECALMLLQELLRPGVWHGAAVWRGGDGVAARRTALLERELLLQVTGSAAALLRRAEDAQVALRLALFPVLERLGDSSTLLSHAAELTLCRLCLGAAHPQPPASVHELLRLNGDFLLDAIAHRLRRAAWHPHTPQVSCRLRCRTAHPAPSPLCPNAHRCCRRSSSTRARRRSPWWPTSSTSSSAYSTTRPAGARRSPVSSA